MCVAVTLAAPRVRLYTHKSVAFLILLGVVALDLLCNLELLKDLHCVCLRLEAAAGVEQQAGVQQQGLCSKQYAMLSRGPCQCLSAWQSQAPSAAG
jgi:hypothetical protein